MIVAARAVAPGVLRWLLACCAWPGAWAGAQGCTPPAPDVSWQQLRSDDPAAFTSVRGRDGAVWIAGGDPDGPDGPAAATLLVTDDADAPPGEAIAWTALTSDVQGDWWWVEPVSHDVAYVAGSSARIVRVDRTSTPARFAPLTTPRSGQDDPDVIVFGIYASSPDDVWAVGGRTGGTSGGFAWHSIAGGPFVDVPLPTSTTSYALWKAAGTGPDDVWLVGSSGLAFHFDGLALQQASIPVQASLFTVDVDSAGALAVGGLGRGVAWSHAQGESQWQDVTPDGDDTPALFGVHRRNGEGCAVGAEGALYDVQGSSLVRVSLPFDVFATLHACFVDDAGATWAVGGLLASTPLRHGVLLRKPAGR